MGVCEIHSIAGVRGLWDTCLCPHRLTPRTPPPPSSVPFFSLPKGPTVDGCLCVSVSSVCVCVLLLYLKLGALLLSPHSTFSGYLGAIFTGVLKNGLPFTVTWASQILRAAAWLNVAMRSGYGRAEAMRAIHKGVFRAYATAPHDLQATVKAIHHISYHLPSTRHHVAGILRTWLKKHAYCILAGGRVQQLVPCPRHRSTGYNGVRDQDFCCLRLLAECADTS